MGSTDIPCIFSGKRETVARNWFINKGRSSLSIILILLSCLTALRGILMTPSRIFPGILALTGWPILNGGRVELRPKGSKILAIAKSSSEFSSKVPSVLII